MSVAVVTHVRLVPGPVILLGAQNDPLGSLFVVREDLDLAQLQRDGTYLVRDFDSTPEQDSRWMSVTESQLSEAKSLLEAGVPATPSDMIRAMGQVMDELVAEEPAAEKGE